MNGSSVMCIVNTNHSLDQSKKAASMFPAHKPDKYLYGALNLQHNRCPTIIVYRVIANVSLSISHYLNQCTGNLLPKDFKNICMPNWVLL